MKKLAWRVTSEQAGCSLQLFVKFHLEGSLSAKAIKRLIDSGHCHINDRLERYASFKVGTGDKVTFLIPDTKSTPTALRWENARILYEDAHFIVYDKPPGVNCDPEGLQKLARTYVKQATLVHRLDRDTSGVILIAKSSDCFQRFVEIFRSQKIAKYYLAITQGIPQKNRGTVHNYIGAIQKLQGQVIWGAVSRERGLEATTKWQRVAIGKENALIRCQPVTGRTHQIRVHLSGLGYPIVGDYQYGWNSVDEVPARCYLHAESLIFRHPYTDQEIAIMTPLPEDMAKAWRHKGP